MRKELLSEGLGTALLMAAVVGSTAMGSRLSSDPALGLLFTSLICGVMLFVLITILGPVSGGHLNPAVTLMARLQGEIGTRLALAFVGTQVIGAVAGTVLAHLMFDLPVVQISTTARALPSLWLSEAVATGGLIFVILGGIAARGPVPALVGTYVMAGYWFTGSSGFSNPAMTVARTLTDTAAGLRPVDLPAYLVAQFIGALIGYGLGRLLFAQEKTPGLADGG